MKSTIVIPATNACRAVLRHTWEQAKKVKCAAAVVVAADSDEIAQTVRSWGGQAILTEPSLSPSTLLGARAALEQLEADFILNVQTDKPFVEPSLLEHLLGEADRIGCDVITAVNPIQDSDDLFNPSIVKVLRGVDGRVLYFTRNACPYVRDEERLAWLNRTTFYRHIGVYGYTTDAIRWYSTQPCSPLEKVEKLEQLRFIEHGWHLHAVVTECSPQETSTLEDLKRDQIVVHSLTGKQDSSHIGFYQTAREVIYREIDSLQELLARNREAIPRLVELLYGAPGKIVVTGLGKSGLIGHKIAATFASTGSPAVFLNAAEALHGDLGMVEAGDFILMISNSAATSELLSMLPSLKRIGARCAGLFGKTDTPLAAQMEVILSISASREACPLNLAPMSTTTNTLVLGDALAAALMRAKGFHGEEFAIYHPGGSLGRKLLLTASDVMPKDAHMSSVDPGSVLREVVAAITNSIFGAICVCDCQGKLQGIITDGDIRRHLVKSDDLTISAAELMTRSPITVAQNTRLVDCLELMERRKVYVVPVVDEMDILQGMIRMHDIVG